MNDDFSGWRDEIKAIDRQVIRLLEQRFELVEKIGAYKKQNNLPIRDEVRERLLIEEMIAQTRLHQNFIRDFYQTLFTHAYLIEQ
jgi:chorismate mutase